jgi:hypothetical protein
MSERGWASVRDIRFKAGILLIRFVSLASQTAATKEGDHHHHGAATP